MLEEEVRKISLHMLGTDQKLERLLSGSAAPADADALRKRKQLAEQRKAMMAAQMHELHTEQQAIAELESSLHTASFATFDDARSRRDGAISTKITGRGNSQKVQKPAFRQNPRAGPDLCPGRGGVVRYAGVERQAQCPSGR